MDQARMGEIALLHLKHKLRTEGVRLRPDDFRREVGNTSKAIGITIEEGLEFSEVMIRELVEGMFAKEKGRDLFAPPERPGNPMRDFFIEPPPGNEKKK